MMGRVPAYVTPGNLPEGVRKMLQLVGNAGRAQVLHALAASRTPMGATELSAVAEVPYRSCWLYLQALEEMQLVSASVPPGPERHGRRDITWTADRARIRRAMRDLEAYLLGGSDD